MLGYNTWTAPLGRCVLIKQTYMFVQHYTHLMFNTRAMWPFVIECVRLPVSFTSSYFSCTKNLICALIFFRLLLWSVLTWSSIWTMSVNHSSLCSGSIMRRYAGSLLLQTSRNTGSRLFEASFECNTWKNQTRNDKAQKNTWKRTVCMRCFTRPGCFILFR